MSGAALRILRMRGGISVIDAWSVTANRNRSWLLCGSKSCPRTIDSIRGRSDCNSLSSLSPLTVRSYARPLRIKSGSPNISRSLSSARLMAGWLKKQRFAARVTCRSSKSACKASSKFRSTCLKCVWRMSVILTMHQTASARCHPMLQKGQVKENYHVKFSNEERDYYWCLWWNRKLDRKTSGKRRVCGGGELRRKSSSGAVFGGGYQGCGGTGHRCASRCGDCRRRGAALQRVDGSFRQA